jgi:tetratricopeptide (TPR) repeat protein
MPHDDKGMPLGGLDGIEKHYRELSTRYGYSIPVPESALNDLGYRLMEDKKFDDAIAIFRRNVDLYPGSANVYDSLGEGYENARKYDLASQQFQRAVELGTRNNDPNLSAYSDHVKRVNAELKTAADKAAGRK